MIFKHLSLKKGFFKKSISTYLIVLTLISCRSTSPNIASIEEKENQNIDQKTNQLKNFNNNEILKNSFFITPPFEYSNNQKFAKEKLVDKKFLLEIKKQLELNPDQQINPSDYFNKIEKNFIKNANQHSYKDIFLTKKNLFTTSYSSFEKDLYLSKYEKSDQENNAFVACKAVYFDPKKNNYFEKPRNPLAGLKHRISANFAFSYCIGQDKMSDQDSIIYFFHGVAGNENHWLQKDSLKKLRYEWRKKSRLPKWAAISLGPKGTFMTPDKKDLFSKVIIPWIEQRHHFNNSGPKFRFGMGVSMGGLNILSATINQPATFTATVAVCPAIASLSSFSNQKELQAYLKRTGASKIFLQFGMWARPKALNTWSSYINLDPFYVAQKKLNKNSTPLWIQTSSQDEYGFQEGGKIFAMLVRTKGSFVVLQELKGRHCVIDTTKIHSFFLRQISKST